MTLFRFMSSPVWLYWIAPGTVLAVGAIIAVNIVNRVLSDRHDRRLEQLRVQAKQLFSDMSGKSPGEVRIPDGLLENLEPLRIESASLDDVRLRELRQVLVETGLAARLTHQLEQAGGKWDQVRLLSDLAWLGSPDTEQVASDYLGSRYPEVAYAALAVLAGIDTASAYASLVDGFVGEALSRSRVAALAETANPRAETLMEKSHASDPQLRYWCAYLMGRSRLESTKDRLIELSADADPFVRTSAAKALGWLSPSPSSTKAVEMLLEDPEWHVRAQAAKAVGYLRLEQLAPKLLPLLGDANWWVREDTVDALEIVGGSVISSLIENLHSSDRFVRNRSAELLGRLGTAQKALAELAADQPSAASAADLLVDIGKAEAVGVIEAALEASTGTHRLRLITVMQRIGGERAAAALRPLAEQNKDKKAATAATDALKTMTAQRPGAKEKRRAA